MVEYILALCNFITNTRGIYCFQNQIFNIYCLIYLIQMFFI